MGQSAPLRPATVLLVEDEVLVRMEFADMLEDLGFSVLEANDADEAMLLLVSRPDIELMVTDIDMPGSMDGVRLARHVRDRWPPVKILVVSGNASLGRPDLPAEIAFLPKPFENCRLADAIARLMV